MRYVGRDRLDRRARHSRIRATCAACDRILAVRAHHRLSSGHKDHGCHHKTHLRVDTRRALGWVAADQHQCAIESTADRRLDSWPDARRNGNKKLHRMLRHELESKTIGPRAQVHEARGTMDGGRWTVDGGRWTKNWNRSEVVRPWPNTRRPLCNAVLHHRATACNWAID